MHYTLTQQIPSEVQKDAYETFIRFLRGVTEQELFLPTEHLSRYPHRQYCLLLSPSRVRELFEVYNPSLRYSQRLVNYRGYNLIVDKGSQLSDTEAYLIAPSKYTLFLRQVHDGNEIKIYRSNFVDLTGNTPPPPSIYMPKMSSIQFGMRPVRKSRANHVIGNSLCFRSSIGRSLL